MCVFYSRGSRSFSKNFPLYGSNVLKASLTCVALMTRALSQRVIAHPILKAVVGAGWLLAGFSPPPRETDAAAASLITISLTRTVVRTHVVHPAREGSEITCRSLTNNNTQPLPSLCCWFVIKWLIQTDKKPNNKSDWLIQFGFLDNKSETENFVNSLS